MDFDVWYASYYVNHFLERHSRAVLNRNSQVNHFLERHSRGSGNPGKKRGQIFNLEKFSDKISKSSRKGKQFLKIKDLTSLL